MWPFFFCAVDLSAAFTPHAALTLSDLERLVRDTAPEMRESVRTVKAADAQVQSSRLLENPVLSLGVGTVPLGSRNPPGLDAITQVMNYGAQLSYKVEILKRGRRQARDRAVLFSEHARDRRELRLTALAFAKVLGLQAATRMRLDYVQSLIEGAKLGLHVAEERAKNGSAAWLEANRMQIEVFRLEQQLREAEIAVNELRSECSHYTSRECTAFPSVEEARSFLNTWLGRNEATQAVTKRSDLRALEALQLASKHDADLARAERVPDFTLSVGYLHDRFTISGNQLNSLNFSLQFPLPMFNFGQAQEGLADMRAQSFADERALRTSAADARITSLQKSLVLQRERRDTLVTQMLPRARTVLAELEKSLAQRLIPQGEVLSARRALIELLLAEADSYTDSFAVLVELLAELPEE